MEDIHIWAVVAAEVVIIFALWNIKEQIDTMTIRLEEITDLLRELASPSNPKSATFEVPSRIQYSDDIQA